MYTLIENCSWKILELECLRFILFLRSPYFRYYSGQITIKYVPSGYISSINNPAISYEYLTAVWFPRRAVLSVRFRDFKLSLAVLTGLFFSRFPHCILDLNGRLAGRQPM